MTTRYLESSLHRLRDYIEAEEYQGYDPYDVLNAKYDFSKLGRWAPFIATQLHKRNLINLRKLLGIQKGINPKTMGLLLQAYTLLYEIQPKSSIKERLDFLVQWLWSNYSQGYRGYCWGYNFDWAARDKYLEAYTPSVVVTAFVAKGLFECYRVMKNDRALQMLRSACDFILNDLPITECSEGVCFSYTPIKCDCCYNASMLGAEILAKTYSMTNEIRLRELAEQAAAFTVAHQHDDGHWNYSIDLTTGREKQQIDFHQGYVLDSLADVIAFSNCQQRKFKQALLKGADYYRRMQFFENGRSKWRVPKVWPVEIHNQSQGIITFSRLAWLNSTYLNFARRIAEWTIDHMQNDKGFFHYRKHRFFTNKIPYMRWAQAWMFLALTVLLKNNRTHDGRSLNHASVAELSI